MHSVEHDYDELYRSGGYGYESRRNMWEEWVEQHYISEFGLRPGETLLDVGCGDGFWTSIFAGKGFKASGTDLSVGGIEVARTRYPEIEFLVRDIEQPIREGDRQFDIVFCRTIEHLSRRDLFGSGSLKMASNLMRLLRPGGLALISHYSKRDGAGTPNHAYHRVSDLVKLFESAGDVFKVVVVSNYVQLAVQHWTNPRTAPAMSSAHKKRLTDQLRRIRRVFRS